MLRSWSAFVFLTSLWGSDPYLGMPADIQDHRVGPSHRLDYSDDINHIPRRLAGLVLPNLLLQTNSIIAEAK